jgi:hypothetical protein
MLGSNSYQRLECQQRYVTKVGDVGIIYFCNILMVITVPDQGAGNCLAPGPNGAEKSICAGRRSPARRLLSIQGVPLQYPDTDRVRCTVHINNHCGVIVR